MLSTHYLYYLKKSEIDYLVDKHKNCFLHPSDGDIFIKGLLVGSNHVCGKFNDDKERLIDCLKRCHRKHNQGDDSIGWTELEYIISKTLAEILGNKEYCKWLEEKE